MEGPYGHIKRHCKKSRGERYDRFPGFEWKNERYLSPDYGEDQKNSGRNGLYPQFFRQSPGLSFLKAGSCHAAGSDRIPKSSDGFLQQLLLRRAGPGNTEKRL